MFNTPESLSTIFESTENRQGRILLLFKMFKMLKMLFIMHSSHNYLLFYLLIVYYFLELKLNFALLFLPRHHEINFLWILFNTGACDTL